MSKWRQKGFVQDSDEEEDESQLESQGSRQSVGLSGRVERVEDGLVPIQQHEAPMEEVRGVEKEEGEKKYDDEGINGIEKQETGIATPTKHSSPRRPTPSPFTPKSTRSIGREPTESPDPLLGSPTPRNRQAVQPPSSQRLASPILQPSSAVSIPQLDDGHLMSISDNSTTPIQVAVTEKPETSTHASSILREFGIAPLSDDSDDDLSDPPSDLESPPPAFAEPHRRTAVQVVIPSATALQRQIAEDRARREFRQRKPIQMHPYALEGEMYRREVQSRGLKPVRRERSRSPQGHRRQPNDESQEQEFNPDQSPTSSPPEVEIPVSTPVLPRPRKDLVHRPTSGPARRPPSTQLRHPHAAKRRKHNFSSTQAAAAPTSIFEDSEMRRDIWSIPPNSPPYSSSPPLHGTTSARRPAMLRVSTPAPNLPTPSTSSVMQEDPQMLQGSDSEPAPHSIQRSGGELRRPTRVVITDSSSSAAGSASEAEKSDDDMRNVGRKIKGVLPASWLRFDRQAQERRKVQQRERERARINAAASPEPTAPVRGVAQRIMRPAGRPRQSSASNTPSQAPVVISDDSDDEPRASDPRPLQKVQDSVADASALAAMFDDRYADDNLSDMEHDRLPLPTLGGTGSKRRKQTKLTDAFAKSKKVRLSDGLARNVATGKRSSGGQSSNRKHGHSKKSRRTPPPAMSVIDIDLSPSRPGGKMPQFLRIARRQALQRPDLARQSVHDKQIRLHNAEDTEEANTTLRQWQRGTLKPRPNVASQKKRSRHPLADRIDNQQHAEQLSVTDAASAKGTEVQSEAGTDVSRTRPRKSIPAGLHIFQRSTTQVRKSTQRGKKHVQSSKNPGRAGRQAPLPFRTAQLEGDENDFGRGHRKIAFEKGLLRVDQQFGLQLPSEQPFVNPQLARYLADDNTELPPLPSARDVGEGQTEGPSKQQPPVRRRLKRKVQAQRIDVDAREYRQPSEPAVDEILKNTDAPQPQEVDTEDGLPVLHGLGPYGTRYPITFDVYSLATDTYFHSSTFIGADEFRQALRVSKPGSRDLDELAGHCTISHSVLSVRCGPWNDETFSRLQEIVKAVSEPVEVHGPDPDTSSLVHESPLNSARLARSLIGYITHHLSFLDPIDRDDCVAKLLRLCQTIFDNLLVAQGTLNGRDPSHTHGVVRAMAYLLVISLQVHYIAQHPTISPGNQVGVIGLAKSLSKTVVAHLMRHGIPSLSSFLEQNQRHSIREKGIQDTDVVVESTVICMHVLEEMDIPGWSFWDLASQELSSKLGGATTLPAFEATWATMFTFLPYNEIDLSGIPLRSRRETFKSDNWACIRDLLRRLFELYPSTYRKHSTSLNGYVRANLARCHRLIAHWHWRRPELMLNAVLDFFGKNGLKSLRREAGAGSVPFLNDLATAPSLNVEPNENSFHISLKCLALGLQGMSNAYPEKKIRSFVFRSLPNHGRAYPKDQPLDEENLAALRNHHDLLSTLYWAAPPACRPKLDHIRDLVNHESSHREACRVSVRAWANLATFQLSTEEPYTSARPFASWHKDIMHQTLIQYKLAKTEADDYLKSGVLDGTTDVSAVMVRQTMEKNQGQVIATLRDCIAGMSRAIQHAKDQSSLRAFLVDSDIMHLLELPHLEDHRLVNVIRDVMKVLQDYAKIQKANLKKDVSQQTSEESQDYGDFPDMDDLEDMDVDVPAKTVQQSGLDFIQTPLWHLLSNAFGAENSPDDNLLMDCIDTWVRIAEGQVLLGERSWSYYLDSFSQVSWKQLRQTEQTRKFGPYFMAALADCDSAAYEEHRHEFFQALMVSLVERESMLRFQHRLLHAIAQTDEHHPLMQNLPFFRDLETGKWDITADTLRTRRLALISSILSNMRDDIHAITRAEPLRLGEMKRLYASMLKDFMTSMKYNYQQLRQGTTVTGAYVEFVQKIVQFLKQYANDICPVLPFFTDSVAFPLPAGDPTYVVARLCGYAPKLSDAGTAKQLSFFIQTVAQQAAADNQQAYLVNQLTTALCTDEAPTGDRVALRSVLLQGIFPAYLEEAFSSSTAFAIAKPILQALPATLETMIFDLRITQPESLASTVGCIVSISHAFIRGTEQLKDNHHLLQLPYVLAALTHMLQALKSVLSPLEYICNRTMPSAHLNPPPLVTYIGELIIFIAHLLRGATPDTIPSYAGDAHAPPPERQHADLLAFCRRGLEDSLKTNWSESAGSIWFGQGHARREVLFDIGGVEEQRGRLERGIEEFQAALHDAYGFGDAVCYGEEGRNVGYDMVV
ncbi:hypothetical protein J4E93_006033 [Alternaria ventricosa]|uniref:uncharacterized protein n=1 Tax=Alternaria ventricosa TaxID=1187951 RepID=UPI0020C55DBC|nr:uncharacterized protein J4E93_006033 [Alternaria ventricosa]KAI4645233.1 hypothetical protein J4E93_006033 [Alternaria ventricosa]